MARVPPPGLRDRQRRMFTRRMRRVPAARGAGESLRSARVLMRWILTNPVTWIVVAALVAATGGWVSLARQHEQEKEIKGWLMGGESWAYYVPWRTKERNLAFFIRHTGAYPAYDVVLRIQDELKGDRVPGDPIYIAPALLQ